MLVLQPGPAHHLRTALHKMVQVLSTPEDPSLSDSSCIHNPVQRHTEHLLHHSYELLSILHRHGLTPSHVLELQRPIIVLNNISPSKPRSCKYPGPGLSITNQPFRQSHPSTPHFSSSRASKPSPYICHRRILGQLTTITCLSISIRLKSSSRFERKCGS